MEQQHGDARQWAVTQFGAARLGDSRRTKRLVAMARRAAEQPAGCITQVFRGRERETAYDFVENRHVRHGDVESAAGCATARACSGQRALVPIDGSSISVVDHARAKTGRVGTDASGGRGLKVMSALAVGADGCTLGVLSQVFWARPEKPTRSRREKRAERERKGPLDKETAYWLECLKRAAERLDGAGVLGWFQVDREGDAWPLLLALAASDHWYTVRSSWNRVIQTSDGRKDHLRTHLAQTVARGAYELAIPPGTKRTARRARMVVHAAPVVLMLRDKRTDEVRPLEVNAVWVREVFTTPQGEAPLEWLLLTNAPIGTMTEIGAVVAGYAARWRIEDLHRTWKSGRCNVEDTQLRSVNAIATWATILAVVAARIERLKLLAQKEPSRPATIELTQEELDVLIVLKRSIKKKTETIPDSIPTIGDAVRWIAELGGYTGKSSGGPPGSETIGRGLERLQISVEAIRNWRAAEK